MKRTLSAALLAFPMVASAGVGSAPVIGGSAAPAGKWPDAAALLWGGQQACTGTLIAPNVVLTAGHCVEGDPPDAVLVGTTAKSRPQEGETIRVMRAVEYPNSWNTIDAAVLVLAQPSTVKPRPIAMGWTRFDIKNGAPIQLVGYGTTDRNANVETDSLMEAASTITDYDCSTSSGCNNAVKPDGELGAGGMGIDTCPGDSGGPLYLNTEYGAFLTGITSRGYNDNRYYCSEGGIYGRADNAKLVQWIEQTTGVTLERTVVPTAEAINTVRGVGGETTIVPNDPKPNTTHTFAIKTQPGYGLAAVNNEGTVRVCPKADIVGEDAVVVTVTDQADPTRTLDVSVPVFIADGEPDDDCDPMDFGGSEGGGCCDTRRSATGSIPLALAVVALGLRRRRRTR